MIKSLTIGFLALVLFISCEKSVDSNAATASTTMGGKGGSLARFTLAANHLYIVDDAMLRIFDVSNPKQAVLKNIVQIGWGIETIFPYKNNLFIGSRDGMFIYSIDTPSLPRLKGQARHVRSCDPVVANDSIAFVTLRGGSACGPAQDGLYVYNIKNLLSPTQINLTTLPTPNGLGLQDSILYVCQKDNGLSIYNVQQPANPVKRRQITTYGFEDVIPMGNLLICYVKQGLVIYDITEAAAPKEIVLVGN